MNLNIRTKTILLTTLASTLLAASSQAAIIVQDSFSLGVDAAQVVLAILPA